MTVDAEKINQQNIASFKKLLQGRGALTLFYYLAVGKKAEDHRLTATMASKDKKGTKALNMGKKLKSQMSGKVMWSYGSVELHGKKIVLVVRKGQLGPAKVRKAVREIGKVMGFGPLGKAGAMSAGDDAPLTEETDDTSDDVGSADDAFDQIMTELSDDERLSSDDILALQEAEGDITANNTLLAGAFSVEADDSDFEAQMEAMFLKDVEDKILAIESAGPEQLATLRTELASLVYIGSDLPAPPGTLSSEQRILMDASMDAAVQALDDQLARLLKTVMKLESQIAKGVLGSKRKLIAEQARKTRVQLDGYDRSAESLVQQRERIRRAAPTG